MQPHRGIVRTDRRSDCLSMRQYEPNNLTRQSAVMNDALSYLLQGPITNDRIRCVFINSVYIFQVMALAQYDPILDVTNSFQNDPFSQRP